MSLVENPAQERRAGGLELAASGPGPRPGTVDLPRVSGLSWAFGSELLAGGLGFVVMVHLARRLGPSWFAGRVRGRRWPPGCWWWSGEAWTSS